MRLYLSSEGLGREPEALAALIGGGGSAAVVLNAGDDAGDDSRPYRLSGECAALASIGITGEELDLRSCSSSVDTAAALRRYDAVWVAGGNTFVLRAAMWRCGFDDAIRALLADDRIVYAGYSAGSVAVTPSLRGIELVDDPSPVPPDQLRWDGIGLVPYSIAPHYRSASPDSPAIDNVVAYFRRHHMPFRALTDGDVIVINEAEAP